MIHFPATFKYTFLFRFLTIKISLFLLKFRMTIRIVNGERWTTAERWTNGERFVNGERTLCGRFVNGERTLNKLKNCKVQRFRDCNCISNKDLFHCNIINSPLCIQIDYDYQYFFFTCPKYKDARNISFDSIFQIHKLRIVNTHVLLLLYGDNCLLLKTNICSLLFKPLSNTVISCELFHHDDYFFCFW
jgi:hypothetical protein